MATSAFDLSSHIAKTSDKSDLKGRTISQPLGEYSYGLSTRWNVGIKVPTIYVDSKWYGNGVVGEVKYLAPHGDGEDGFYWGFELEAGYLSPFKESRSWVMEAVPILGYRVGRWHFIANPGLSLSSAGDDKGLSFEPNFKRAYQFDKRNALGLEYYIDAGMLKETLPGNRRNEVACLAWDTKVGKNDVNFGIGRGTSSVSDRWMVKLNVEFEIN